MKITDISVQARNNDRVNISVDGKYRFSLDMLQVTELGIKVGKEFSEEELTQLEDESQFGKLYSQALEYTLMRPHSAREVRDYLWRKTQSTKYKARDGQIKDRQGVTRANADRVLTRLIDRGYIDDEAFAKYWRDNRQLTKGISSRKLIAELRSKGIESPIIDRVMQNSPREERSEIQKVLAKKRHKYDDEKKLITYLMRQGFAYDVIREALTEDV